MNLQQRGPLYKVMCSYNLPHSKVWPGFLQEALFPQLLRRRYEYIIGTAHHGSLPKRSGLQYLIQSYSLDLESSVYFAQPALSQAGCSTESLRTLRNCEPSVMPHRDQEVVVTQMRPEATVAPVITTRNKKLLVTKGIAAMSKN